MTNYKNRLLACTLSTLAAAGALASDAVMLHTPTGYQIMAMSPNAKWACGVYSDAGMNVFAFRWNLESGRIEMLGTSEESIAWGIANDGTISGNFCDNTALPNGAPVQMPGYHRDGRWHSVEMPADGRLTDGLGYAITPDGHYISGSIEIDGKFTPFIWKDGKIVRNLNTGADAMAYCISPDGQGAAGWSMLYNRTSVYWPPQGDPVFLMAADEVAGITAPPYRSQTFASHAQKFSPDGTKLLYWGGWLPDEENREVSLYCVYDIASGKEIAYKAPSYDSDIEYFDISNNGTLLGENASRGVVRHDGQIYDIDEYLRSVRGVTNLDDFDDWAGGDLWTSDKVPVTRAMCISEDESAIGLVYYNKEGQMASMVIKIDQSDEGRGVTDLEVKQLEGLQTVALTWAAPVGMTVRGYNVYRDGTRISGMLPLMVPYYYDTKATEGTHTYEVGLINNDNKETLSEAFDVDITTGAMQAPVDVLARMKGVDGVLATWERPWNDMVHKRYFTEGAVSEFSVYEPCTMEGAIAFGKMEMTQYAGYKISEVSFYPMAQQKNWAIKLYTRDDQGKLTILARQEVTQDLICGERNTVKIENPVDVPAAELIVSVEVEADGVNPVMGAQNDVVTPCYSDLLKQSGDSDFFSAKESSEAQGYTVTCLSWAIDLGLIRDNAEPAVLTGYNVYVDGNIEATVAEPGFTIKGLSAGEHMIGVEASYGNGKLSERVEQSIETEPRYPSVDSVNIEVKKDAGEVAFSWKAPTDNDRTWMAYTTAESSKRGPIAPSDNGYAFKAAVIFDKEQTRSFGGYVIENFRFYPLADAMFTVMLYENGEEIFSQEAENVVLNAWNELIPASTLTLKEGAEYVIVLDIFDPDPAVAVLGMDNEMTHPYAGDLYSINEGESWNSIWYETSLSGNWMLGMNVADTDGEAIPVDGYRVKIDGTATDTNLLASCGYTHRFADGATGSHSVSVDVKYTALDAVVEGKKIVFLLKSGIESNLIGDIELRQGLNMLTAEGEGITGLRLISAAGAEVSRSRGNSVEISTLAPGVYIVMIEAGINTTTRKIRIR